MFYKVMQYIKKKKKKRNLHITRCYILFCYFMSYLNGIEDNNWC
jgi:hypothetical protein